MNGDLINGLQYKYCRSKGNTWFMQKTYTSEGILSSPGDSGTWQPAFKMCPSKSFVTSISLKMKGDWKNDPTKGATDLMIRCKNKASMPTGNYAIVGPKSAGTYKGFSAEDNYPSYYVVSVGMYAGRFQSSSQSPSGELNLGGLVLHTKQFFAKDGTNVLRPNWVVPPGYSSNQGIDKEISESVSSSQSQSSSS